MLIRMVCLPFLFVVWSATSPFNPGNVLWVRSRLSGLVDWQWACVGLRSIDPAHCRLNLWHYNPTMADDVRTVWEQRSGLTFDPWADLASIIGTLDNIRGRQEPNATMWTIEAALKQAVNDLSRPASNCQPDP